MNSSKHNLLVMWEATRITEPDEAGWVDVTGKLSLGLQLPDDDIPTFIDKKVSFGAMVKEDQVLVNRSGCFNLLDHKVNRPSILGDHFVPANDKEIHLLTMQVLAEVDLRASFAGSIEATITEIRNDGQDALLTVVFEGEREQASAFFTVEVRTKGWTEYGNHFVGGTTEIQPESYMEEAVHWLVCEFYPNIDLGR